MDILDSLKLIGPNRRSEDTVIEVWLRFSADELAFLETRTDRLADIARKNWRELGLIASEAATPKQTPETPPGQQYAAIIAHTALLLQQKAGHRVFFHATYPGESPDRVSLVVEFEHGDTGLEAVRLAFASMEAAMPDIALPEAHSSTDAPLAQQLHDFFAASAALILPPQTQDIIDAARRLDIPVKKLDRDPYEGLSGEFRIRPNGMLKLGQARHQRVIDGNFPIDSGEALAQMVHDRAAVLHALKTLGARLPDHRVCTSPAQAATLAQEIGYPVVVKPRRLDRARHFGPVRLNLDSEEDVAQAVNTTFQVSGGAIIESFVQGDSYRALLGHDGLLGVFRLAEGIAAEDVSDQVGSETAALLTGIGKRLDLPLVTLTLVSSDITRPPGETGRLVNMDLAPDLDEFLPSEGTLEAAAIRQKAAEGIVRKLFPEGSRSRVPLVSVTGTNGKSTVCTMISRIMQGRGFTVGMAATTGLYTNRQLIEPGDRAGGKGHNQILDSTEYDFVVLETARGAVSGLGLMFDHSDVAVCTNVSSDHLGERGIETVEQMAELKQFIIDRARRAVVLNADDTYSADMFRDRPGCQSWVVSAELDMVQLRDRFGPGAQFCIAHEVNGVETISLYREGKIQTIMPVNEIPATFNGIARFNVSNSLQAIAAACALGASPDEIRFAMSGYATDFQTSPGRLNVYDGLPFRVIFDFAHNEGSHRALREIVDAEKVSGRKILLFSRRGDTTDERILEEVSFIADGYDLFICFDNPKQHGRAPYEVSHIIRKGLIRLGVDEANVIVTDTDSAFLKALDLCREGDLLVACTTTRHLYRDWEQITSFKPSC